MANCRLKKRVKSAILQYYAAMSFIAQFEMCVVGFSYREYSILNDHETKLHKMYRVTQVICYLVIHVVATVVYFYAVVDEEEARNHMQKVRSSNLLNKLLD